MGPPDTPDSAFNLFLVISLGGALCACGHLPRAFDAADPLDKDEHLRLGAAYESAGLPADALTQFHAAVSMAPKDPEAWLALGNAEYHKGEYSRAEEDYLRALKISPRHSGAKNNLAMTYLAQNKRLDEAERLATEASEQDGPLRPYVLDTLAQIRARRLVLLSFKKK